MFLWKVFDDTCQVFPLSSAPKNKTLKLTDLQLPGDASFALVSEVDLSLVVLCHHLNKLLGEDGMLGGYIQDCVHIPEPAAHKQERIIKTFSTQEGKHFKNASNAPSHLSNLWFAYPEVSRGSFVCVGLQLTLNTWCNKQSLTNLTNLISFLSQSHQWVHNKPEHLQKIYIYIYEQ